MLSKEISGLIFAIICAAICTVVWYRYCFIPGVVEKYINDIKKARKKSNPKFKGNSILFKPIFVKAVFTFIMLMGFFAVYCAIVDVWGTYEN